MSALAPRPQYPSFKFDHLGAKIRGTIVCPPEDRQARDFTTQKPKFWSDGQPVMQTKIVLRVEGGQDYAIYAEGRMAKAITQAIIAAGAPDLLVNGVLEVEHHELGEAKGQGQRPKEYRAFYLSPGPNAVSAGPADDDDEGPPF